MQYKTKFTGWLAILSVSLLFGSSCRKNVAEGQLIEASGVVTEAIAGTTVAAQNVYLYGAHIDYGTGSIYYTNGPLDSAVSDENGHFSMQYKADGKSVDYALSMQRGYSYENTMGNYEPDQLQEKILFNNSHKLSDVNMKVRKTSILQLHLVVGNVTNDSLVVIIESGLNFFTYNQLLKGSSVDAVIKTNVLPNQDCYIRYLSYNSSLYIDSVFYHREQLDTIHVTEENPAVITRTFSSTDNFPLRPY